MLWVEAATDTAGTTVGITTAVMVLELATDGKAQTALDVSTTDTL